MNTYIQDKLDEFDEIVELTIELIEGGAVLNKNDLKMALKEKTKKLFTDTFFFRMLTRMTPQSCINYSVN